ncbi:unnamed protein product, partial [Rotaria sp. Silwood2]
MEVICDEQTTKQQIIELSLKYNILSPHTAFIGIEKRTNANNTGRMLREVPIEISADDQHLFTPSRLHFLGGGAVRHSAGIRSGAGGGFGGSRAKKAKQTARKSMNMISSNAFAFNLSAPMELSLCSYGAQNESDCSPLRNRPIQIDAEDF